MFKKLFAIKIATAILLFSGCATTQYAPFVDAALTIAVGEALSRGVQNPGDRATVAAYVDQAAAILRNASTDTPPEVLSGSILAAIPGSARARYPEITLIVTTLIVPAYQAIYSQYHGNASQFYAWLNRAATDIETGAAPYVGP